MVSFATERRVEKARTRPNMGNAERIATGAIGALLAADAIARPGRIRLLGGFLGSTFMYWAATGYCPIYGKLGINHAARGTDQAGLMGAKI